MPKYNFSCPKCNLKFERNLRMNVDHSQEVCPDCESIAEQVISQEVSGVVKEGTAIPVDIDRQVGKDADEKWAEYAERKDLKEKIKKETGAKELSKDLDGGYTPLGVSTEEGIATERESLKLRREMVEAYKNVKNDPKVEVTPDTELE